ncbi:MAG: FliA/WhiG family RNA polymerase sigma factor [Gemmatimonadota bacterium]
MTHALVEFGASTATAATASDDVSRHLGLVYHVARSLSRKGCGVELDELVSAGTIGLIEAAANFDSSRGHSFTTFATPRIRGAMLDELRRLDHVPRSIRRHSRAIAQATDALTGELGAVPDATQLAERLGVDRATVWRWTSEGEGAQVISLNSAWNGADDSPTPEETSAPAAVLDIDEALTREQEVAALREAILALGARERTVLALYYYEEMRLSQIAELLGVTESRVSQIRSRALSQLREHLAPLRDTGFSAADAFTPQRLFPGGAPR